MLYVLIYEKMINMRLYLFYIQVHLNSLLILKTTGALEQGKIANSVTTAVIKSGGVTSYNKLRICKLASARKEMRGLTNFR
jgi:hypothetical protein